MNEETPSKEERILRVMRSILIDVIKDTTTERGLKHPLSEKTIDNIRHGLDLITARQKELADDQGITWDMKPRYPDQPRESVVVNIDSIKGRKDKGPATEE